MPELPIEQLLRRWTLGPLPSLEQILASMDPISWTFVLLLVGAIGLGIYVTYSTRHPFVVMDQVEWTPEQWLERLKRDPTQLSPLAILNRLGGELTLALLEHGDRTPGPQWRATWTPVREELLRLLGQQEAFGPTYVLARYYQSADPEEPETVRVRRTALIHMLGQRRHLDPAPDGTPAQLRIRRHPAEPMGDLGFDGPTLWLEMDEAEAPRPETPTVEMDVIDFHTVESASLHMVIRRASDQEVGITLHLHKRFKMWVVVDTTMDWS